MVMGSYLSRQNDQVEEINTSSNLNYTFPPKSGPFFSDHFYMGGKKFETAQPEGYLFGDNSDLNYLGPKPHHFSYQLPDENQPVRALKCLVNIRKDSLRLVRAPNSTGKLDDVIQYSNGDENQSIPDPLYNLEFIFDSDCPCSITIYYNTAEKMYNKAVQFKTKPGTVKSDTAHFNSGCNQQFCVPGHVINPALVYNENYKTWDHENIPIAIQVCANCGSEFAGHSHITYAVFEKVSDGSWIIKATKQKQVINGVCYLFQEIYGIENKIKSTQEQMDDEEDLDGKESDDDNSECVVCLSDLKDTLILPCKHLCLCSACASQLRFQQSGCPICRQPFRALLQIRAVRKKSPLSNSSSPEMTSVLPESAPLDDDEVCNAESALDLPTPPGYEAIPLINAINGPVTSASFSLTSLASEGGIMKSESLRSNAPSTKSSVRRSKRKKKSRDIIDIENEVSHDDDENRDSDRKKSRSWRKKKSAGADPKSILCTPAGPLPSGPQHVYVNENLEVEDIGVKGEGDYLRDSITCDDVTMSVPGSNFSEAAVAENTGESTELASLSVSDNTEKLKAIDSSANVEFEPKSRVEEDERL